MFSSVHCRTRQVPPISTLKISDQYNTCKLEVLFLVFADLCTHKGGGEGFNQMKVNSFSSHLSMSFQQWVSIYSTKRTALSYFITVLYEPLTPGF